MMLIGRPSVATLSVRGRVHAELARPGLEEEPPITGVDEWATGDTSEERTRSVGVVGVVQCVYGRDHV